MFLAHGNALRISVNRRGTGVNHLQNTQRPSQLEDANGRGKIQLMSGHYVGPGIVHRRQSREMHNCLKRTGELVARDRE